MHTTCQALQHTRRASDVGTANAHRPLRPSTITRADINALFQSEHCTETVMQRALVSTTTGGGLLLAEVIRSVHAGDQVTAWQLLAQLDGEIVAFFQAQHLADTPATI